MLLSYQQGQLDLCWTVQGAIYPKLAGHIANFLAQTLFKTSLIALPTDQYRCVAKLSPYRDEPL